MTIEFLLYPLIGILSGFLSGFFGVGGGIVIVPSLHFLYKSLGYSDEIAIPISLGTALACIIVNALSAIPVHHKNGTISWSNFRKLLLGIVIGPFIGALISVELDKELFKKIFALFIFLISLRLFFKSSESKMEKPISYTIALPFGGFVGTLSSLLELVEVSLLAHFYASWEKTLKELQAPHWCALFLWASLGHCRIFTWA